MIAPEEKVDLLEALKSYTINGACASFDWLIRGSFEIGKNAKMIILLENIRKTPVEEILRVKVEMTIINGKIAFNNSTAKFLTG